MAERIVYLIRHGQYEHGDPTDNLGGGLTEQGRQQAEITAQCFRAIPLRFVHYSSLRRAAETAAIIATAVPDIASQPARDLWEIIPAIPPGESTYFALNFPGLTQEQVEQERKTAEAAFTRIFRPPAEGDEQEVVVCHGNIIRYFACRVLNVPLETWANMETHNCGITRVSINTEGRMMLISLNDIGHLPQDMRTFT